ncbi:hypothetical protein K3495_g17229 [Podosphaera aphanis]|nr:hypothetical protein K3495_g17229 [Podosphaera aphanis]
MPTTKSVNSSSQGTPTIAIVGYRINIGLLAVTDPSPGMVPNNQRYQAYAVAVEPISYQQAIQANDSDL